VLAFSAAETAQALGVSVASANSSLQRARVRLEQLTAGDAEVATADALDARQRDLLERYVKAFEAYDTQTIVGLLSQDATWEMPPYTGWYLGADAIGTLIRTWCPAQAPDDLRLVITAANGQPACALYMRGKDGVHRAFHIHVLDITADPSDQPEVSHVSCFFDTALFAAFGLPLLWDDLSTREG
jgi:RNA polymerase sigma-70 factor (ECF subfamily)